MLNFLLELHVALASIIAEQRAFYLRPTVGVQLLRLGLLHATYIRLARDGKDLLEPLWLLNVALCAGGLPPAFHS